MAWTVTRYQTVFGNKRAVGLKCTADAATFNVETGLSVIEWFTAGTHGSMASQTGRYVFINSGAGGTAINGTLGCSGFATGDDIYFTVYGR
jgi:hypothetical protein